MKQLFGILLTALLMAGCGSEETPDMLVVEGNVSGLRKGTLYLQEISDTTLVNLDSVEVMGSGEFRLSSPVAGPDVFYLNLDKADNNAINDRITFFAAPGTLRVDTQWDNFEGAAEISGSEAQEKFAEYRRNQSRYHVQLLELAHTMNEASQTSDSTKIDSLQRVGDRLTLRSYLYALNFALNNKDSYVAPYVAITEVSDANPRFLDSIYQALTPDVAASKYGKKLKELLETQ